MKTDTTPDTEPQNPTFESTIDEIHRDVTALRGLSQTVAALQQENARMGEELSQLRRVTAVARTMPRPRVRPPGAVSDECAQHVAAHFIALCERSGRLDALCSFPVQRDTLVNFACATLSLTARSALTTANIPLPSQFGSEIRELTSEFGIVRRYMTRYPIGMGTAKPARMGTRPAFTAIAMSAAIPDVSPTLTFASLESHKIGGLVRLPREIDEQSIVDMGHYLARYGAIEFARAEDKFGFLADGDVAYENIKGIVTVASENSRTIELAPGKTKPSDATLDDFRLMRTKVNRAALNGRVSRYYVDSTWETRFPSFKTDADPLVYQRLPDGSATLDGYPIVWTDVLEPYGTSAAAGKPLAVFGSLGHWWLGEHGMPRMDTSDHVLFVNDQLAVRFIEEIDFDYSAVDATSALLTAQS